MKALETPASYARTATTSGYNVGRAGLEPATSGSAGNRSGASPLMRIIFSTTTLFAIFATD